MKKSIIKRLLCLCLGLCMPCIGYTEESKTLTLTRIFPNQIVSDTGFQSNIFASPILDLSQTKPRILIALSDGKIAALDAKTGAIIWQTTLPAPKGHTIVLVATPVKIQDRLVTTYSIVYERKRQSYRVAVINLNTGLIDARYPVVELAAKQPMADGSGIVAFNPKTALARSDLVHAEKAGSQLGYVYVSFGNASDIQPFHGWMFELDMDSWLQKGAEHAISSSLLTTPETYCPEEGKTGSRDMICGGGIWTPAGPLVLQKKDFELIVPVGNGQFDLKRKDYAGTLMRVRQGLEFDPACDAELCRYFDPKRKPDSTDLACMASCRNLFIPRLMPNDPPLRPASGVCDNKSFWECLMWNDYDLGANAPAEVTLSNGLSVLVQPGKEGGLYLLDSTQLGVQYDRQQMVPLCGAAKDKCMLDWAGMAVTQPAVTEIEGVPLVIVATFMPDKTHAAGLLAYKIILHKDGKPRFQRFWQAPNPASAEALQRFRWHPSRVVISPFGHLGELYAWVTDINKRGTLLGVRIKDGEIINRTELLGTGRPHSKPLIYDGVIYAPANSQDRKKSWLEAYQIDGS